MVAGNVLRELQMNTRIIDGIIFGSAERVIKLCNCYWAADTTVI